MKSKIIIISIAFLILIITFVYGGKTKNNSTKDDNQQNQELSFDYPIEVEAIVSKVLNSLGNKEKRDTNPSKPPAVSIVPEREVLQQDESKTILTEIKTSSNKTDDSILKTEISSQTEVKPEKKITCNLTVTCYTILDNWDSLDPDKKELIPADGIVFPLTNVEFYEGESVFNVLQREMKKNGMHLEFTNPPGYQSSYIEGINNIYEFDCSELSGWMYKVNGGFPRMGSSLYILEDGDTIEWIYTCDLGRDIGGYKEAGKGQ